MVFMIRKILCAFLFTTTVVTGFGQALENKWDSLNFYSDVMLYAADWQNRSISAHNFEGSLQRILQDGNVSVPDFTRLKFISSLYPQDSSFVLLSWQYPNGDSYYHNGGAVYFSSGKSVWLKPAWEDVNKALYRSLSPEQWYGAIYFQMLESECPQKNCYTLLGYRHGTKNTKSKLVDVICINDEAITFGKPFLRFQEENGKVDKRNRHVINYSASANCVLNYNPMESLIQFDHVVSLPGHKGELLRVPDGSYEAFECSQGGWRYVEKLKVEILESAPREKPVINPDREKFRRD